MTERNEAWPPGTPCWVDLVSADVAAARSFYGDLFGWQINDSPPEFGGYLDALVDGRPVAGLSPVPPGQSLPTVWTTYLSTADADATAAAIEANGGKMSFAPFDVAGMGRFGLAADPTGAAFGIWQAGEHIGMELANVPGACAWNECITNDYQAAKSFYAAVFGVTFEEMGDDNFQYATIHVNGDVVGGIGGSGTGEPSTWGTYFACASTDETLTRAVELGGSIRNPAADNPYGRTGVVQDPQGAPFSVIQLAAPS